MASPHPQRKTIVIGFDDADRVTDPGKTKAPSELYVYVGTKQREGHPVERAGLTNGDLYGVQVRARRRTVTEESNDYGLGGPVSTFVDRGHLLAPEVRRRFELGRLKLQDEAIRFGIARFQRIEDGAWDPRPGHATDLYFVTTANVTTNSRLWRLRFNDIERPQAGGTIEILLDGSEGHRMLDNVGIDRHGRILLQEDVGGNDRLGKIWLYSIERDELVEVAAHDAALFAADDGEPEDDRRGVVGDHRRGVDPRPGLVPPGGAGARRRRGRRAGGEGPDRGPLRRPEDRPVGGPIVDGAGPPCLGGPAPATAGACPGPTGPRPP